MRRRWKKRSKQHKIGRLNYCIPDFGILSNFLENENGNNFYKSKYVENKWKEFFSVYCRNRKKYTPRITVKETKKKRWFNKNCSKARKKEETGWNKWRE